MIPKEILQKVRRIEIKTRSIVEAVIAGNYHSVFKGQGMEFSEVRTYVDGDDIRSIDWNVTARMREPYVKKHIEERELTTMLLVDGSASNNFGSVNQMKGEMAVELCALLAFSAIKNNDRVGLIIFTDEVEKYVPPKKGKNHVLRVIRELLYFKPQRQGTNIEHALKFLNQVQRKKTVTFLVSDFFDSQYESALRVACKRHDCIAITISDPREASFPNVGLIELEDPETGEIMLVDSGSKSFRDSYAQQAKKRYQTLTTSLRSMGVDQIDITTEKDYVDPIIKFFRTRERHMAKR